MSTKQLIRTLIPQQPHHTGVCHKPSTGGDQDVVLSSRAICCSVAKQHEAVPTAFQSETQMVGNIGLLITLGPTDDSTSDSIAVKPQ